MTQAAIAADIHQALDVHLDALAEIAFDFALIDDRADLLRSSSLRSDLAYRHSPRFVENRGCTRFADTVDVGHSDLAPFIGRKIYSCYTSHLINFIFLVSAYAWDLCKLPAPRLCGGSPCTYHTFFY